MTVGTMWLAVVDAVVATDGHSRICPRDHNGDVAVQVLVVGATGKRPMRGTTGHVGEAGAEGEAAAGRDRTGIHADAAAGCTVGGAVILVGVAANATSGISLRDHNGDVAVLVVVVGATGERPMRGTTGHVGEAGAAVQTATYGGDIGPDTHATARCAMRGGVILAGVAADATGG